MRKFSVMYKNKEVTSWEQIEEAIISVSNIGRQIQYFGEITFAEIEAIEKKGLRLIKMFSLVENRMTFLKFKPSIIE